MERRRFLKNLSLALGSSAFMGCKADRSSPEATIMTVTGPVPASSLGFTLTHEHILVDFAGADQISSENYDPEIVLTRAIPHLNELKSLGVATLVECTPAYIGRDAGLMRRLSEETGVRILTNTGFYGARDGFFVPTHIQAWSPEKMAEVWIEEARSGIEESGIRPGFIKTAVHSGPLSKLDRKLARATAIAHKETGLVINSHTTQTAIAGMQQLEILMAEGVRPDAWVWVHAQSINPVEDLRPAFEAGAWISFDNLRPDEQSTSRILDRLTYAKENNWLGQVLISHDGGWYDPSKPDGGPHRPYTALFTHLLPALKKNGFSQEELDLLTIGNPAKAFRIEKRLL